MSGFEPEILDDAEALTARDSGRLLWELATAGAAVRRGHSAAGEAGIGRLRSDIPPRALLVASDASNADSAQLLVAAASARTPSLVWEEAELPGWAGPSDALLVGCLQGMSARLAQLVDGAQRRGLAIAVVAPLDSAVAESAGREPVVPIDPQLHPLASRWSVLAPLLAAAAELGVIGEHSGNQLAEHLDTICYECRPVADSYENPAKSLALQLMETYPVVIGSGTLAAVAAQTIAHSFQGIAGVRSIWATMPNGADRVAAVVADGAVSDPDEDLFRDRLEVTELRPRLVVVGGEQAELSTEAFSHDPARYLQESPAQAAARQALRRLQTLAERSNLRSWTVEVPEASALIRFAVATAFGDFTAGYLALAAGRSTDAPEGNLL